jgi:hypothetical protein
MREGDYLQRLNLDADQALFEGKLNGLIIACYANERPLQGLAGLLDWRFRGTFSRFIRDGAITGDPGECTYLPIHRNGRTFHLLLAGAGQTHRAGHRNPFSTETVKSIRKNIQTLQIQQIGISRKDLGNVSDQYFIEQFKEVPVWITP